jgi:hypothetical protein
MAVEPQLKRKVFSLAYISLGPQIHRILQQHLEAFLHEAIFGFGARGASHNIPALYA